MRLLTQPGDGIDLAIVSQQTEWLDAFKTGGRVGRIPGMTDRNGGGEIRIAKPGIVLIESLDGTTDFVDDDITGEGRNTDLCFSFDLERQVK